MQILLIEDHGLLRESETIALERDRIVVYEAWDAPSVRRALRERHYHAIVTDLCVPGFVGAGELLALIEAEQPEAPVVVVSTLAAAPSAAKPPRVWTWLRKPCSLHRLRDAVRDAVTNGSVSDRRRSTPAAPEE